MLDGCVPVADAALEFGKLDPDRRRVSSSSWTACTGRLPASVPGLPPRIRERNDFGVSRRRTIRELSDRGHAHDSRCRRTAGASIPGQFFWLDLDDPDPKEIGALGEILGLHELAVEDTQEFGQRSKADAYGEELLLVYYGTRLDSDGTPVPVEVTCTLRAAMSSPSTAIAVGSST